MTRNPYTQYKQMQVETTDPLRLVVMLYEGAIKALRLAIEYIGRKDYELKGKELMRAHDIIFELLSSLDREAGGEIAKNLESLYVYIIRRILEANASMDVTVIEEVINHLKTLNEAWTELAAQHSSQLAAEAEDFEKKTTKVGESAKRSQVGRNP